MSGRAPWRARLEWVRRSLERFGEAWAAARDSQFSRKDRPMETIVTVHVKPPIPTRDWDWCAHFDGKEEGLKGWGPSEALAIQDLKDQRDFLAVFEEEEPV